MLFIDLNFYQPSLRMHTLARLIFEFKNGVIYPTWDIQTLNFFQFDSIGSKVLFGLYCSFLIVFIIRHLIVVWRYMSVLGAIPFFVLILSSWLRTSMLCAKEVDCIF